MCNRTKIIITTMIFLLLSLLLLAVVVVVVNKRHPTFAIPAFSPHKTILIKKNNNNRPHFNLVDNLKCYSVLR